MNCEKCETPMTKFRLKKPRGYGSIRVNNLWVCPKCGYEKEITNREK